MTIRIFIEIFENLNIINCLVGHLTIEGDVSGSDNRLQIFKVNQSLSIGFFFKANEIITSVE